MYDEDDTPRHFKQQGEPDAYDRAYGLADGFPRTRPTVITDAKLMAVGGVWSYTVQTFRVPEHGDEVFILIAGPDGLKRIHLPSKVTTAIARQRDMLSTQSRRRAGKARAEEDKAAGRAPGFLRCEQHRAEADGNRRCLKAKGHLDDHEYAEGPAKVVRLRKRKRA